MLEYEIDLASLPAHGSELSPCVLYVFTTPLNNRAINKEQRIRKRFVNYATAGVIAPKKQNGGGSCVAPLTYG